MKMKISNAGSAIKAGELIISEQPFVFILSSQHKGSRCDNCLEKGKTLKCSGCQFVHYCGRACQKEAWIDHKWECANLKRVSPKVIPDAARMLARILNRLSKGDGQSYRAFYSSKSFRMWKDLMSHYRDLKTDKKRMEHFWSLCEVLQEFLEGMTLPNTVELMGMYGRMVINSFTILDTDMNSIGTGIYLASSIVDHSCDPNAVATFDGKTLHIRAIKDMPSLDWDQVRISYIDLMKTPYERQTELLENYYFCCQCDKCIDGNQAQFVYAAKCPNPKCDRPVNIKWKENCQVVRNDSEQNSASEAAEESDVQNGGMAHCKSCGTKYNNERAERFVNAMEFTENHLRNMKDASVAYVDVCRYCLSQQEGLLHPLNVMYAQTLDHAFDALISMRLWPQACQYAEDLIPCFRFYYGDHHPLLGLLHLKYGKILLYITDIAKALTQLKASEKILKVTHGNNHSLYKEELMPLLSQATQELGL